MEIRCKICQGRASLFITKIFDDRYGYPKYFDLYRCENCKSFITWPQLDDSEISNLYTNYYPRRNINVEDIKKRANNFKVESDLKQWLGGEHRIHRKLPRAQKIGIKVLDVGCGDGSSLFELKTLGYDGYGIEADENLNKVKNELGLNIHIGMIEDCPYPKKSFDYIVANQVIEHVVNLDSFIEKIKEFLKDDGVILMSTPNADSIFRKIYGKSWIHWHIPYHQQILSPSGVKKLFEEKGLIINNIHTVSPTSWTVHEINRLRYNPKIGEKSPFWNRGVSNTNTFIGRFLRKIFSIIMFIVGKIFDQFNQGNCLMIEVKTK